MCPTHITWVKKPPQHKFYLSILIIGKSTWTNSFWLFLKKLTIFCSSCNIRWKTLPISSTSWAAISEGTWTNTFWLFWVAFCKWQACILYTDQASQTFKLLRAQAYLFNLFHSVIRFSGYPQLLGLNINNHQDRIRNITAIAKWTKLAAPRMPQDRMRTPVTKLTKSILTRKNIILWSTYPTSQLERRKMKCREKT